MKTSKIKRIIIMGICCFLLVFISSVYSINFNDKRLVEPMDFSSYIFISKDIPMILSIVVTFIYVIYLFILIFKYSILNARNQNNNKITRELNPKMGLLGILGFIGFLGFWTYSIDGTIFPFCFFSFFGFFGFFYEGKMSNTFIDERFKQNREKANLMALKLGYSLNWIVVIFIIQGIFVKNLESKLIFLLITISLIAGLTIFLSEYLLYKYDYLDEIEDD